MARKHLVSIIDIKNEVLYKLPSKEKLREKLGDMRNYLILLEALITERIENENDDPKSGRENSKDPELTKSAASEHSVSVTGDVRDIEKPAAKSFIPIK